MGTIGLEIAGRDGLLRSLAVAPERRGRGIAGRLHQEVVALARGRGLQSLYLLTSSAEAFAAARGFERVSREQVPPAVAALAQFRSLCPASSICMRCLLA